MNTEIDVHLHPVPYCFAILVVVEPLTLLLAGNCQNHLPDEAVPINFFVARPFDDWDKSITWLHENRAAIEARCRNKLIESRNVN
jgi:hypothetical protein